MQWVKIIQRIIATTLIFIIWVFVYKLTLGAEKISEISSIDIPINTTGVIMVNLPQLQRSTIFQFAFNNKDPRILKITSEYWQNIAQDTSNQNNKFPIDFNDNIYILKVNNGNETNWLLAGRFNGKFKNEKNPVGFIRGDYYYSFLNVSMKSDKGFRRIIKNGLWYSFNSSHKEPIQYHVLFNRKSLNTYGLEFFENELNIHFANKVKAPCLSFPKNESFFHLTTLLNSGSYIPDKFNKYKRLIESLAGISLNYFGAKYIDEENSPSYIEPQIDLLLTFAKKTKTTEILPLLNEVTGFDAQIDKDRLVFSNSTYYFLSKNDSTIYIGKHPVSLGKNNSPFVMQGNPSQITLINNLGWKSAFLELIPEYKVLKDFSQSIENISSRTEANDQILTINFKKGVNAQLESFLLLLTMANAYQF
jgi:hypothetical protein